MHTIDLNCDMGEGVGNDDAIMPYISSANIACGYHAGDETTIKNTIELALKHGVAIGAHPGFDDKKNFGRVKMALTTEQLYALVLKQIHGLQKVAAQFGTKLHHVKPHGAMYNMAAKNKMMASIIAKAVKDTDEELVLYGLYNSFLISCAQELGLKTANEVFADRAYTADGSLAPRTMAGSVIQDENKAAKQVTGMVLHNTVATIDGKHIYVNAQTLCLHGDGKHAAAFAKMIRDMLGVAKIAIQAP